jgi:Ribbon-helix-helix protein, copG family
MATERDEVIRARVSAAMKQQLEEIAAERDEKVSVIIREAIKYYLTSHPAAKPPSLNQSSGRSSANHKKPK